MEQTLLQAMSHQSSGAQFDAGRCLRYALWRFWDRSLPFMLVIGLNPSTADETKDDATIRRCIGFGKRWGFGGLVMMNLFSYVTKSPKELRDAGFPGGYDLIQHKGGPRIVGDASFHRVLDVASDVNCGVVLAAWGVNAPASEAATFVRRCERAGLKLKCFGVTKSGKPKHPLYLPYTAKPREFSVG